MLLAGFLKVGAAVWSIGYALLIWRQYQHLRFTKWRGSVSSQVPTRIAFCFGLAGPLIHLESDFEILSWIGVVLAIYLVRFSGGINEISRSIRFAVYGVKELELPTEHQKNLTTLIVSMILLPPGMLALELAAMPGWIIACVVVAVGGIAFVTMLEAYLRRKKSLSTRKRLHEAMQTLAPVFVLYWVAPRRTAYQVAMWLPYLKRIGLPFVVLVRNKHSFDEVVELGEEVPVIWGPSLDDVNDVFVESISSVFYVNHSALNLNAVRYRELQHIQIHHGDSEKESSYSPVTNMFDRNYVAGQAAVNRYAEHGVNIPAEKFEIVGRPQVEDVQIDDSPIADKPAPRVLYATTWNGFYNDSSYSSLTVGLELVKELVNRGSSVIFRPHPWARKSPELASACSAIISFLEQDRAINGTKHIFGREAEVEMAINDCFNACDVMISDVSSVVSDFLFSHKPLGIMSGNSSPQELISSWKLAEGAYVLSNDKSNWTSLLDDMLSSDSLRPARQGMREYYLGPFEAECYSEQFVNVARSDVLAHRAAVESP